MLSKMKPMMKRKGELHGTGHTKFSPDACFGLIKRKFRRTNVSSLDDLARVVNESAACNLCQLVGTQDGTTIVPSRDWAGFLSSHFAAWMVSSTVTSTLSRTIQGWSSSRRLPQRRRHGACCEVCGHHHWRTTLP